MRWIVLSVSMLAAGCTGQALESPVSPSSPEIGSAATPGQGPTRLPFSGNFTAADRAVVIPPSLFAEGTAEGTATQLGRFTASFSAVADLATPTATGTFNFRAANGDQLVATFTGEAVELEPGVVSFTEVFTITGGTGRFLAATGTFTMRRIAHIDFAAGSSTSSGSFEGVINLNK